MNKVGTKIESYTIRYDIKQESGYWLRNQFQTIEVKLQENAKEKCNHNLAREKFLKFNPDAEIISVIYQ